jgi:hypothetical protein
MNNKIFKNSVMLASLLSLFSTFSGYAMEMPPEHIAPERRELPSEVLPPAEFPELGMRAAIGYSEHLGVNNRTGPVIITILGENERSMRMGVGTYIQYDIANDWFFDNPASTLYRPEVFEFTLSKANGEPIGNVKFLMNNDETDVKVELNIGSYHKTYVYDVDERGHLLFFIDLADDETKPAGNFEHTAFVLQEMKYEGGRWTNKTISPETNEQEFQKRVLERQKKTIFEHERLLGRPEIQNILEEFENPEKPFKWPLPILK